MWCVEERNALRRNRCILERIDRRHMVDLEISFYFPRQGKNRQQEWKGRKKTDRNKEKMFKV